MGWVYFYVYFEKIIVIRSINDIKDSAFSDEDIPQTEMLAMVSFDRYRIQYLRDAVNDEEFEKRYMELRVMANNVSFEEFLKDNYNKRN